MATEAVCPFISCLGVSLCETPLLGLAVLTDSPKSNPEELMLLGVLFWE